MGNAVSFDLSTVFRTVAEAIPDQTVLIWRDLRLTYAQMDARIDGVAHYLVSRGLGCHIERDRLAGHQSGQDHVGLYMRNGNEYLEAMVAGYRARVAPFNVNFRYVEEELLYLLTDSGARALIYSSEFAPARSGDPGPAARSAGAHPGGGRLRQCTAARCGGLRIHHRHTRTR